MTKRAYDPEFEAILPLLPTVSEFSTLAQVQAARAGRMEMFAGWPPDRADVTKEDRLVPGPAGAPELPIRIYRPNANASGSRGCVFEIHRGGFIMGSIDMMDPWCQRVAAELGVLVVSVPRHLPRLGPAAGRGCLTAQLPRGTRCPAPRAREMTSASRGGVRR